MTYRGRVASPHGIGGVYGGSSPDSVISSQIGARERDFDEFDAKAGGFDGQIRRPLRREAAPVVLKPRDKAGLLECLLVSYRPLALFLSAGPWPAAEDTNASYEENR